MNLKPPREYRDPAKIIEIKQEHASRRSCSGCAHWSRLWGVVVCLKHEGRAGQAVHMCDDFVRREGRAEARY